jgi:hypothetical protein
MHERQGTGALIREGHPGYVCLVTIGARRSCEIS